MAKESKANAPVSGGRIKEKEFWAIMEEMTRLYGGWLCYLLRRLPDLLRSARGG